MTGDGLRKGRADATSPDASSADGPRVIAVDARVLAQTGKGVPRFLFETLRRLALRTDIRLVLFSNRPLHPDNALPIKTIIDTHWRRVPGSVWMLARLNRLAREVGADTLWGPSHVLPQKHRGLRTIVTVHDLVHRLMPETMDRWNRFVSRRLVDGSIRRADRIVAVSNTTRSDMITLLGMEPSRVDVVRLGVRTANAPVPAAATTSDGYLFVLGSIEPRKNISGLLDCFGVLRGLLPGLALRLTGAHSWSETTTLQQIRDNDACTLLGFLSDADVAAQMAGARAFVMPSHYEGFGLPIVEAVGIAPVIAADIPIFRELADAIDGIHFVDFGDANAAAASIATFLAGNPPPARFRPGAAAELNWDTVADRYAAIMVARD